MTPEAKVKKDIKDYLDSLGSDCWYFMPVPMGYGRKGIPDIIACVRGSFVSIEVKAKGKIHLTTPWQLREQDAVQKAGGLALIVDNVQDVKNEFGKYFSI